MKRNLLSLFFTIFLLSALSAQATASKKFQLMGDHFSHELVLQAKPVGTEEIVVYVYSQENKETSSVKKLEKKYTINRGLQTIRIDIASLPNGNYTFDIVQRKKVKNMDAWSNRCVFSQNFRKD